MSGNPKGRAFDLKQHSDWAMKAESARKFEAATANGYAGRSDTAVFAKAMLAARQARNSRLPQIGFADDMWMLLLDLFVAQTNGNMLSLSDLYFSAAAPKATTLRMIGRLVDQRHLETLQDPNDGRRTLVRLSDDLFLRMGAAVEDIRSILAIFDCKL